MGDPLYDRIGRTYAAIRRPDPRLAGPIWKALGDAQTVVNVGAGAGSYEPTDRHVTAVEPSAVMIAQRPPEAAQAVQAAAESLPFPDDAFDAAMAVLTIHHWDDVEAGLAEMVRVARRRVVIVTFDPEAWTQPVDRARLPAGNPGRREGLEASVRARARRAATCHGRGAARSSRLHRPHVRDPVGKAGGVPGPQIRAATSVWHQLPPRVSARALDLLARDLASGAWDERYGHLRTTPEWDVGLRLVRTEL